VDGQLADAALQRYGAHVGLPAYPAALVQAPSALAPSAAAHTSHEPSQVVSQQKPFTQWPTPRTHSLPSPAHGWPVLSLQRPAALHVSAARHATHCAWPRPQKASDDAWHSPSPPPVAQQPPQLPPPLVWQAQCWLPSQ